MTNIRTISLIIQEIYFLNTVPGISHFPANFVWFFRSIEIPCHPMALIPLVTEFKALGVFDHQRASYPRLHVRAFPQDIGPPRAHLLLERGQDSHDSL